MRGFSAYEADLLKRKGVIDYYPEIIRYHTNELLTYFDLLNTDYIVERKKRLKLIDNKEKAILYINEVKKSFKDCLGEMPQNGSSTHTKVVATIDKGRYLIDKVLIESLPGYYLSANFYYPKKLSEKAPGILCLCGHAVNGKAFNLYVSFCVEAVLNGFCVLIFDPVGQGERKMYSVKDSPIFAQHNPDNVHYLLGQQISLIGDNITQYMMWDNIRALDYLCAREEVDEKRIGITGNSGGGQMSAFMGAYDERPSVIAPCSYITELRSMIYYVGAQETEQSLPDFMKKRLDIADLIIAAAPKPYFIGANLFDFFPIEGTKDAFIDAMKIYEMLGSRERLAIYVSPKPHGWWHDIREKVLQFMCEYLGVEFLEDKGIDYEALPDEKELLCLPDGDIDSYNTKTLQQIIQSKAEKLYPSERNIESMDEFNQFKKVIRRHIIEILKIDQSSIKPQIINIEQRASIENGITKTDVAFYSEKYMKIYCTIYKNVGITKTENVLVYVGPAETQTKNMKDFLKEYSIVVSVEVRGTGRGKVEEGSFFYTPEDFFTEEASYNCNAAMLGKNVLGMRVLDVLSALELVKDICQCKVEEIAIYGRDEYAIIALFVAVLSDIKDITLEDLLYSYKDLVNSRVYSWGPSIFAYGLLKYFDVDDLIAALLPAKVRIKGILDSNKRPIRITSVEEIFPCVHKVVGLTGCQDIFIT